MYDELKGQFFRLSQYRTVTHLWSIHCQRTMADKIHCPVFVHRSATGTKDFQYQFKSLAQHFDRLMMIPPFLWQGFYIS